MAASDQGARQMHACRNLCAIEYFGCERLARQSRLALQPLAHLRDTRSPQLADHGEPGGESCVLQREAETDDVQRLAVPSAGDLDAIDVLQAELSAGCSCCFAPCGRVVVGESRDTHTACGTQLDERARFEHAIGVMTVKMKIGERTGAHRRYDRPMSLPPGKRPDWSAIDTVLLDLDGTLLDLAFDNYIWLARVSEIYAENHGLSLAETHAELAPRFARVQGTLDWYCIHYWTRELGIDIEGVHREEAHRIAWLPGARGFLEQVRARGKRLVLMTNSHPVILEIKQSRTQVLGYLDAAFTSHGFGAPKEEPRFWAAARAAEPFDPARTMFVDDSRAVLHAAIAAGIRWVYGVKRPDSSRDPHEHAEFAAIEGVADLL